MNVCNILKGFAPGFDKNVLLQLSCIFVSWGAV